MDNSVDNLRIPLAPGESLASSFGVLDIEPLSSSHESFDPTLVRSVQFEQINNTIVTEVTLPPGQYVAQINQPRGGRITKLIQVSRDIDGAGMKVDVQLTNLSSIPSEQQPTTEPIFTTGDFSLPSGLSPFSSNPYLSQSWNNQVSRGSDDVRPMFARSVGTTKLVVVNGSVENANGLGQSQPDPFPPPPAPMQPPKKREIFGFVGDARRSMDPSLLHFVAQTERGPSWPRVGQCLGLMSADETFSLSELHQNSSSILIEGKNPGDISHLQRYVVAHIVDEQRDPSRQGRGRDVLARLPGPWLDIQTMIEKSVFLDSLIVNGHATLHVRVADDRIQSILDFMQQTDLSSALSLVEPCMEMLFQKQVNPYAAAAAAYVLLAAPPERTPRHFHEWVANLGRRFPDIPDGCIQHASLLLQTPAKIDGLFLDIADFPSAKEDRIRIAAELILEALRRGLPLYRSGFKLLVSDLRILQSEELPQQYREPVNGALALVNQLRLRLNTAEPFTVVDVTGIL